MAIRPIKNLSELSVPHLNRTFKSCREIRKSEIFSNLFVTGLEHILLYCRGNQIQDFYSNILEIIPEAKSLEFQETYKDVLEDLELLFEKKQVKILNSIIYDTSFLAYLSALQNFMDVPESKSSGSEYLIEIEYLSLKLKMNIELLTKSKTKQQYLAPSPLVHISLLHNECLFILYPYEYKIHSADVPLNNLKETEIEDMRKNNINEHDLSLDTANSLTSFHLPPQKSTQKSPSLSEVSKIRELETEKRMRNRSRIIKEKIRKQTESKKSTQSNSNTLCLQSGSSPESFLFRNISHEGLRFVKLGDSFRQNRESFNLELEKTKESEKQKQVEEWLKKREKEKEKLRSQNQSKNLERQESQAEELIRIEEERKKEELRISEESKILEEKKREIEKKIAEKRKQAEDKRKEDEKKLAEQKRLLDESRQALEKKVLEENKTNELIEKRKKQEDRKIFENPKISEKRLGENKTGLCQDNKIENEKKTAEKIKAEDEEKKLAFAQRLLDEKKAQIERKLAEDHRIAEQKRIAEQRKVIEELRQAEEQRIAREGRAAEEQKIAEQRRKLLESQKKIEDKRKEEKKLAEEKRKIEENKREELLKNEESNRKAQKKPEEKQAKKIEPAQAEEKRIIKKNEEEKASVKYDEGPEETGNTSYCGGLYCAKCVKDLKRSNYILKCDACNDRYLKNRTSCFITPCSKVPVSRACMNCGGKLVKSEEIHCLRCFLQIKVFCNTTSPCSSCVKTERCYWIDASEGEGDDMITCGFCEEKKIKESVIIICPKCREYICVICLRRNPYLAQAICSNCHSRRQPSLL